MPDPNAIIFDMPRVVLFLSSKAGNSSIKKGLLNYLDVKPNYTKVHDKKLFTYLQDRQELITTYKDYAKIMVVREPVARFKATYFNKLVDTHLGPPHPDCRKIGLKKTDSFQTFVDTVCSKKDEELGLHLRNQTWEACVNRHCLIDEFIPMDTIRGMELVHKRLCDWLMIHPDDLHIPHDNKTRYKPLDISYKQVAQIQEKYALDYSLLDYEITDHAC